MRGKFVSIILILQLVLCQIVFAQERGVRVKVRDEQGNTVEKQLYEGSYALIIGAIDYQNASWAKLDGVRNDIREVEKTLAKQGFTVEKLLNPTSVNLNPTIRQFVSKYGVRSENRLLIYYAGHGYTETDLSGIKRGYIVPIDAPSPEKQLDEFIAKSTTMDEIENFARNIRSKHALFVFDSCFSGTLISRDSLSPSKYISYVTERPVRQFITAGAANQTVPDESTFRLMFVKALDPNDEDNADKTKMATSQELNLRSICRKK